MQLPQRIDALKAKRQQLSAKLNALEAKAKTEERKRDTRRKIVVGAAVIAAMEKDKALSDNVRRILAASVTRKQDIEVLGALLTGKKEADAAASPPAPPENLNPSPA